MRQLRLVLVAFFTSLLVVNAVFLRKVIALLMCGLLSLNSTACYGFLSRGEVATAAAPPKIEINQLPYNLNLSNSKPSPINSPSRVAFESLGTEGHDGITELTGTWKVTEKSTTVLQDKNGSPLEFQNEAIKEISLANRSVDIKPEYLNGSSFFSKNTLLDFIDKDSRVYFSYTFYEPSFHFDSGKIRESSRWLKIRKDDIIKELKPIKDSSSEDAIARGKQARKFLGQALHTLQDFYSHTNWVELGFDGDDEIDKRLGREEVPDLFPANTYTSEPLDEKEINDALYFIEMLSDAANLNKDLNAIAVLFPPAKTYVKILGNTVKIARKVLSLRVSEGYKSNPKEFIRGSLEQLERNYSGSGTGDIGSPMNT